MLASLILALVASALVTQTAVFCTTIYLGHHWLTDNVAAVMLGLFLTRIIGRLCK